MRIIRLLCSNARTCMVNLMVCMWLVTPALMSNFLFWCCARFGRDFIDIGLWFTGIYSCPCGERGNCRIAELSLQLSNSGSWSTFELRSYWPQVPRQQISFLQLGNPLLGLDTRLPSIQVSQERLGQANGVRCSTAEPPDPAAVLH
jgi:hypothetical protein